MDQQVPGPIRQPPRADRKPRFRRRLADSGERHAAQDAGAGSVDLGVDRDALVAARPIHRRVGPGADAVVEAEDGGAVAGVEVDDGAPGLHPGPAVHEEGVGASVRSGATDQEVGSAAAVQHVGAGGHRQGVGAGSAVQEGVGHVGPDRHPAAAGPDELVLQVADRPGIVRAGVAA